MTTTNNALIKLDKARQMLAEARTAPEIKEIIDLSEQARLYAKRQKLGLEAQNYAAEIHLDSLRKFGNVLKQLKRDKAHGGGPGRGKKTISIDGDRLSEYQSVLEDTNTTYQEANRVEKISDLPDKIYTEHKEEVKSNNEELTKAEMLRFAKSVRKKESRPKEKVIIDYPIPDVPGINSVLVGDCRELIEKVNAADVDAVIFDPPYNIGFDKYDCYKDNLPDDEYIAMLAIFKKFHKVIVIDYPEETMRYVVPALGVPDHVGAWCYNSNTPRRFRLINYFGCVPDYSRIHQPYKNPTDKRVRKLIKQNGDGTPLYEWWADIQIVKNVTKGDDAHPCPMPVKLMERIILLTTSPGQTILDPFCGEGNTLVAAKKNGRNYIGFELSRNYAIRSIEKLDRVTKPMLAR